MRETHSAKKLGAQDFPVVFRDEHCNIRAHLMKIISTAMSMRRMLSALSFFALTICMSFSQTKSVPHRDVLADSRQLVLVTTKNWDAVSGELRRFERKSSEESWREIGSLIKIVVGRTGLAWGMGLHSTNLVGPQKVEGDGKSPAGIFTLSSAFGFAPVEKMKSLKLPYLHVTDALECVDDVKSTRYNSIVDSSHIINPDWNSSEKMREDTEQYHLGVVVDHNTHPRIARKGSCIFIHVWKGDGSGTSGCTAMEKSEMKKFIHWLDASTKPVLVQLPEKEFRQFQTEWRLPEIKMTSDSK